MFSGLLILVNFNSLAVNPGDDKIIHAWKLNDFLTEKYDVEIDTMINNFQISNPVFRNNISSTFLGNPGLAARSNFFPERLNSSDFIFVDPFRFYLRHPAEIKYYNTRRPFSLINFSTGGPRGKNEKILSLLHTQNIDPGFNVGFRYFNVNSEGQYSDQQAVTNAMSFFSSYELDNYSLHANLNLNSARVFENGGLVDDRSLYDPNFETEDHSVKLQNVRNGFANHSLFVSQSWQPLLFAGNDTLNDRSSWWQRFKVYHVMLYDRYRRTYEDDNPLSGFYPQVLISNGRTFDSLTYRSLNNDLMVQLPEFSGRLVHFGARGGIRNELIRGSYNVVPDTLFYPVPAGQPDPEYSITDRQVHNHMSNALIASASGGIGDVFGIWGRGSYFFQGFKSGEYDLQAGITFDLFGGRNRSVLDAGIKQKETTPSLFLKSFFSNHFAWENQFRRTGESGLSGTISMPERNFTASVDFNLINNFIYFDHTAQPVQYNDILPVISVSAEKDFRLWKFHFRNLVNYQISGKQDILPLPDISIYQSTWFEHTIISGLLNFQIGFDARYTTGFYGYAWQPAISQFYLQNERMIENYPYIDFFINIKHKRARFFFKTEHTNYGLLDPDYFSALHYPRNERMFKLGVSWTFYN